ncbi:MAG TPA: NAD-dependent epimerase/dehydratase family protein [Solirubrobacteraceae bacterium]|nr:NAD-dependent epimerase/dehydratase family protein [Solirubrobacteraceae bacterium]
MTPATIARGPRPAAGRALVTGCAGFIGSHLCEQLIADRYEVVGVDNFTPYYDRAIKESNLRALRQSSAFRLHEVDLAEAPLRGLLEGIDVVFHLAGQAGVRCSFGEQFDDYLRNNVQATQRLLDAAAETDVRRFVYASSSSVYGDQVAYPTNEEAPRLPVSPYGITKMATEDLAAVYERTRGVPGIGLRYFTAYGPRQRPDMAFSRFVDRALAGEPLPVFGDGRQIRDFTFVRDIVRGTIAAGEFGQVGRVYNVGGGHPVQLRDVITVLGELVGRQLDIDWRPTQIGEATRTSADCRLAERELAFAADTPLRVGLAAQVRWALERGSSSGRSDALVA